MICIDSIEITVPTAYINSFRVNRFADMESMQSIQSECFNLQKLVTNEHMIVLKVILSRLNFREEFN